MSQQGLSDMQQMPLKRDTMALGLERYEPANRRRLSAPALRTFITLVERWGLNEEQRRLLLGYPSRSTYHNWIKIAREQGMVTLDVDVLTRLSALFGIHQALGVLYGDEAATIAWLRTPHGAPTFGGQTPLALMTGAGLDGLLQVRRFLDAARGGIYMAPNAIDAAFAPTEDADIVWRS